MAAKRNSTQSDSPSQTQPKFVKRIVLVTFDATQQYTVYYADQKRAEVRSNDGRSKLVAWTDVSMQAAAVALHDETPEPPQQPSATPLSATERMQRHMVEATGIRTGNPHDAWRALFNRWAAGR